MRFLRRLLGLKALLALLAALLGGGSAPAGPPAYVPGPGNVFVPKPSCATLVDPADRRAPWRRLAVCATTHGLVVRGPYGSRRAAEAAADVVYAAELAAQGGVLR